MKLLSEFFETARERHWVLVRRMYGEKPPWTRDPVLLKYRICNVHREDDRTTQWFRKWVREPLREHERVFLSTIAFRWFNYIPTGEEVAPYLLTGWDRAGVEARLRPLQKAGKKLFTGAFLIKSPPRKDKVTGLLDCIDEAQSAAGWMSDPQLGTWRLQDLHAELMEHVPYLGRFMAYQVVCDLRYTYMAQEAPDVDTWTCLGPGSARGVSRVVWGLPGRMSYASDRSQSEALAPMRELLDASREDENWPAEWPRWELSTVQHWACEFDKICSAREGKRLKRLYG